MIGLLSCPNVFMHISQASTIIEIKTNTEDFAALFQKLHTSDIYYSALVFLMAR